MMAVELKLVGRWCRKFELDANGKYDEEHRGVVVAANGQFCLVQLYGYLIPEPGYLKVVSFADMKDWRFYRDSEHFKEEAGNM